MGKIEELAAQVSRGERVKFLHFWGHRPRPDGALGPSVFSQWWPSPFTVDGVAYATAEHWMMARKAVLFGDAEAERAVLAASSPAAAKKAGRLVRGFDDGAWVAARYDIVVSGNIHKFTQHPDLGAYLLGTGSRVLVEASPLDRIWGTGLAADDPRADVPSAWPGQNLLGFALMDTRAALAR
ncbi:NADAR family protein [Streptomyces sp. NBC_00237]|uniref:NADAR family protein n=1 Tax=Streptomyces sp. NBC_00237 TaxID=2975687 RepID=UPI00224E6B4A|nr:NADAR family protein [Streptomyces sp. NBC_00237]MCX5203881.1 NADAR family protein [Streptomyces sp. NBC_00237]